MLDRWINIIICSEIVMQTLLLVLLLNTALWKRHKRHIPSSTLNILRNLNKIQKIMNRLSTKLQMKSELIMMI
ncbi:MAG TPA: hypothetical protein [Caudoviricetes sp.]|nr:MAG TPA: hypothetical protein [Caudoviricetes sp.]